MKLGFIGCGQMAQALAKGMVSAKVFSAEEITLSDTHENSLLAMEQMGFKTTKNNSTVFADSDVVILAVKPKDVKSVLSVENSRDKSNSPSSKLLISICAGWSASSCCKYLQSHYRVICVMPNVCCQVGESASCFTPTSREDDNQLVHKIFGSVGRCCEVDGSVIDAVTGLSGSGPAFIFVLIDAMTDAAVKGGLPRDVARVLAAQTVLGSAKMVLETGIHPAELRDRVTSPGGTTSVGVAELERTGFRNSIISAVDAARLKSIEMSTKEW